MEANTEEEAEERAIQVLKWLATPENADWLVIFDNVDQHSPLQDANRSGYDISEFFPKADHGSILITSRLQRFTEHGKVVSSPETRGEGCHPATIAKKRPPS
jgi:hypothetical protein